MYTMLADSRLNGNLSIWKGMVNIVHLKFALCVVLAVICSCGSLRAGDFNDFAELDLEAMLNTEIVSAAKRTQKLSESPNAIFVITEEDIRRSGAVDLPDLFRMVPGLDVVNAYGSCYGVSARGFNERFAQRMLILIDGRSVYTSFFGGVFWEDEQVFLEDIERIEIIRGPGATLWGANSVNGVINIITKDTAKNQTIMLTGKAGSKTFRENVTQFSGPLAGKFSLNLTGGYREDEGARGTNDFRRVPKATGKAQYALSENSTLSFLAGVNESEIGLELSKYTPRTDANVRSNYQMLQWKYTLSDTSEVNLRTYRDYYEVNSHDRSVAIEEEKYHLELEQTFALGTRNNLVWGTNYRTTEADSSFLHPSRDHDDIVGLFLQDELTILDSLKLTTGIKYERNSFTGGDWAPRACVIYSPFANHHFRFSVSKAYRTPSYVENSFRVVRRLPPPLPALPLLTVVGNEHLDPEDMTAFELGYRTNLLNRVGINVELYYNEIDDVIENVVLRKTLPLLISWGNDYNVIAKGIELTADFPLTPWLTLAANYTFQEVEYTRINADVQGTPKHKFNINSRFTFKNGLSLDVTAHYVDETRWTGLTDNVKVDDYVRLDMRLAKKFLKDTLEISLNGQNLTDKLHPETSDATGTYQVEQLLYGQVTWHF